MAKEGAQRAEETEQMIEKEGGKEAAEGSAAGSLRAADTKEMRAVVLSAFGGLNKLRVSKKAMPEPQEGELKIRVKAWSSIISSGVCVCVCLGGWVEGVRTALSTWSPPDCCCPLVVWCFPLSGAAPWLFGAAPWLFGAAPWLMLPLVFLPGIPPLSP